MKEYAGKEIFNGIAIGKLKFYAKEQKQIIRKKIEDSHQEYARYEAAKAEAASQLEVLHEKALKQGETEWIDSCTMMQKYGFKMHLIDGLDQNIKITTPEDFYIMRAILQAKEDAQIYGLESE